MEYKLEEIKSMNLFEKMLHIQHEMPTVAKNLNVQTGKGQGTYKAVSERDVKDAVKPLEAKYRVFSYPLSKEFIETDFLTTTTQYGDRKQFYIREKVVYRFVNIDKPDEFIEITGYGDGIDSGDKATGKADTYASKYCIMSAYKISTGDDPDQSASEEYTKKESPCTDTQIGVIDSLLMGDIERQERMLKYYKVNDLHKLTLKQASEAIQMLQRSK